MKGRPPRHWTPEEDQYITDQIRLGVTQREIAREMGITRPSVRARATRLGLYTNKPSKVSVYHESEDKIAENTQLLKCAVLSAIANYANDNGLGIDAAARRLLSGEMA